MCPECDEDNDGLKAKNDPDCGQIQKFGFAMAEDCFSKGDEDGDGLIDCNDPDCKNVWFCESEWEGKEDNTAPEIVHRDIDEYPDGGYLVIDTNEPTRIVVEFYGNDSNCNNMVDNVTDNIIDKRHGIKLRNVSGGIDYNFTSGSTYYYKMKLIDTNNNTAISKGMKFTTVNSTSKKDCPDCQMIVRFDDFPSGWNVKMSHQGKDYTQGCLECSKAAGLLVMYNETLDLGFIDNETNAGIELVNVTPRTLKGTSRDVKEGEINKTKVNKEGGGKTDFVKAEKSKFEDIRDKLRPEECKVYIPGNVDELWHCGDPTNASTCKNRTSEGKRIGYNYTKNVTEWVIPNCEFSAWGGGQPGTGEDDGVSDGPTGPTGPTGGSITGGSLPGVVVRRAVGNVNITIPSIAKGGTKILNIFKTEDVAFRQLNISVINKVTGTKIFYKKLETLPTSVQVPGSVYHYIETKMENITDENIHKVEIKFAVNKSWITENDVNSSNIKLYRWSNNEWISLTVTKSDEDNEEIFFRAESPGLSYFAISSYKKEKGPSEEAVICVENWSCTEWSECIDEKQTRRCTDVNNCGTVKNKPEEVKDCVMKEEITDILPTNYIFMISIVVVIVVIIALVIVAWKFKLFKTK